MTNQQTDFTTVTELPGGGVTNEQLSMALTRYNLAANLAKGGDLLEIACGAGIGLGLIAKKAKRVVGGDIDPTQVEMGRKHYKDRIEIVELTAEILPFTSASFDIIIILEAIYYIQNLEKLIQEVKRVLKPKGAFLITYPNKEWGNFNPSPFTYKYFTIEEMHEFLEQNNFEVESKLGFYYQTNTLKAKIVDIIRNFAVRFHLIPKSFVIKNLFKKIFLGKLLPLPAELDDTDSTIEEVVNFTGQLNYKSYRVVYTIGKLL